MLSACEIQLKKHINPVPARDSTYCTDQELVKVTGTPVLILTRSIQEVYHAAVVFITGEYVPC